MGAFIVPCPQSVQTVKENTVINPADLAQVIENTLGDAQVQLLDKTGESNHFICTVTAAVFADKSPLDRHRMVYDAVRPLMQTGQLHAIEIKTNVAS